MKKLTKKNLNQCIDLLREFIEETGSTQGKKGVAILALEHLQQITAGEKSDATLETNCTERPRAI